MKRLMQNGSTWRFSKDTKDPRPTGCSHSLEAKKRTFAFPAIFLFAGHLLHYKIYFQKMKKDLTHFFHYGFI